MIRLGIVGMGRMGITHFSIINSHPKVEITAVADTSGMVLNLLDKYVNGLAIFKDYKELIASGLVDAILVCTPPHLHFPIIDLAAKHKIHVFCEKPFTTKVSEGKILANIFKEKKIINQVGYVNRYNDCFLKAKELLDHTVIGDIIRFKSEMFSCTISKKESESGWRSKVDNGGGVVFEMASHAIDLVNFLIGKPDKILGTSMNNIYSKQVEDCVSSTFLYKGGKSGTIYANWSDSSYRKPTNRIEVFGTEGKIIVDQYSVKIYLKKENKTERLREGWNTLYITDIFNNVPFYVRGNEFTAQLYDFVESVLGEKSNSMCTFNDALNTLQVVEQMFNDFNENGKL